MKKIIAPDFRKMAEEEVSRIITAYSENWSESRFETCSTRLENMFRHFWMRRYGSTEEVEK